MRTDLLGDRETMPQSRAGLIAVLAGVVAGGGVLGIGGRIAMAALPLLTGAQPRFTWAGSFEVVLLGTLYGGVGGFVLAFLRRIRPMASRGAGAAFGLLMLGIAWLTSPVGRATAPTVRVGVPVVLAVAAVVFVAYGVLACTLAHRWSERPRASAA